MRLIKAISIPLTCLALTAAPALAQDFPDEAVQLKARLAAFAAPFIAEEGGPDMPLPDLAATIVCIIEALDPLPEEIKLQMLDQEDFEDALDLAVIFGEDAGLPMEHNLEACF